MIFTTSIRSSGRRSEQDFINKRIETIERHGSHFLWKTSRWGKNNGDKLIIDRTQDCVKFSLEVRPRYDDDWTTVPPIDNTRN